jgi:DNA-binding NarL/FixJ family response regulator
MSSERDHKQQQQQRHREQDQIEWRRSQVLELDAQGQNIMEIAKILHISHGTVDNDLLYLRKQAQENLQKHIQERIPEEYQKAVVGINKVLKTCWNIINKDTTDDKTKL